MSAIIRRDPFRSLSSWLNDFDEAIFQRGLKVRDTEKDIVVEAVVAGVKPSDVDIDIEDGVVTIKAHVSEEKKEKEEYSSLNYQYYYTTALSGGAWDKAEAEVENGVVKITIPKTEASRPRKISVKAK
ncbi:Hsp20/alpha crystallin family protein [Candidatus Woesebacteria bacterium]|nr:Hsp20/alpha crystallin family protein [Candidatus Woesebacteria bacterium]